MSWLPALGFRRLTFCVGAGVIAAVVGCGTSDTTKDAGDGGTAVLASMTSGGQRWVLEERFRSGQACVRKADAELVGTCLPPIAADHLQGAALRLGQPHTVLLYGRTPRGVRTLVVLVGSTRRERLISSSSRGFIAEVVTKQRRPLLRIRVAGCRGDLRLTDAGASLACH